MTELSENIYNEMLRQDEAKLKLWRYAGLMLTYQCPAACEFCYYNCGPDKSGLMLPETAFAAWESLERLGGKNARIHITGGEPFVCFDHMVEILTQVRKAGLRGPETIETNGFWAGEETIVRDRLRVLDEVGMDRLKISWDPFHAEFVDVEQVRMLARTAGEVLGSDRVLVRWENYLQEPVISWEGSGAERAEAYRRALKHFPCRFTGRASGYLAELVADKPVVSFTGDNCKSAFLSAKGVHIDPYGNVFCGLCSGIVVGNVTETSLEEVWKRFSPRQSDVIEVLFAEGPFGLLSEAQEGGYERQEFYASKCHLCTCLRQFFFDKRVYKTIIGPCECYSLQ